MEDRSNIIKEAIEYRKQLEKENAELKTENKELAHYLACMTEQRNKANTCLQEIKAIAERGFYNSQCNCGLRADIEQILNIINESEG